MSQSVSKSASTGIAELFGVIGTTAGAINTTVGAIGHASDVLNTKAASWSRIERSKILDAETGFALASRNEVKLAIAQRLQQHERALAKDPELRTHYDQVTALFAAADAAREQQNK